MLQAILSWSGQQNFHHPQCTSTQRIAASTRWYSWGLLKSSLGVLVHVSRGSRSQLTHDRTGPWYGRGTLQLLTARVSSTTRKPRLTGDGTLEHWQMGVNDLPYGYIIHAVIFAFTSTSACVFICCFVLVLIYVCYFGVWPFGTVQEKELCVGGHSLLPY